MTGVNNFRHHSDTSVATLRLYKRVGTVHSHRRNPQKRATANHRALVLRPIEATPHVGECQAKIHSHAGRQVDHPRNASRCAVLPNGCAFALRPAIWSSSCASVARSSFAGSRATNAKRTAPAPQPFQPVIEGPRCDSHSLQNCFMDKPLRACSAMRSRHSSALSAVPLDDRFTMRTLYGA